jgi:hypothetical protein
MGLSLDYVEGGGWAQFAVEVVISAVNSVNCCHFDDFDRNVVNSECSTGWPETATLPAPVSSKEK